MKKKFMYLSAFFILWAITSSALLAEVKLPAIFGDNMVLQQQTEAAIWGKATSCFNR